jgi:hypothetical protein
MGLIPGQEFRGLTILPLHNPGVIRKMRKRVLFILWAIFLFSHSIIASEVLILTGIYTGTDLYVQNPILPDNQFSTTEVFVNESLVLSNPLASAFTIDLSHLRINEQVEVKIVHKKGYQPKIVNAHAIRNQEITSTSSFAPSENVFRWINVDGTTIRWLTHGEKAGGRFEIQKAEMEKWVLLEQMESIPNTDESVYRLQVNHEKGENTYRIKLVDRDGYVTYSNLIKYKFK